jgi:DNA adenine methylase
METYRAVRDRPGRILTYLAPMKPSRDLFGVVKARRSRGRFRRAADFIYLNRTSWNALYRVNSEGRYNVPYGRPKTDRLVDRPNLRHCARVLGKPEIQLLTADFEVALKGVQRGDLVFLDPPYVTGHNNNGFIDYNERLFRWADQERLAKIAGELRAAGVHVLATNAYHLPIIRLYNGFAVTKVARSSTIAGTVVKRGRVDEAILVGLGANPRG